MRYLNLDLEAYGYRKSADGAESFTVRVTGSPGGEQRPTAAENGTLAVDLRARLRRLEKRNLTLTETIALGEELGAALFPRKVREIYSTSVTRLQDGEGLRIRLMIDSYPLADIPWEYVYLSDADTPANQKRADGFLVFDSKISLVRYEQLGKPLGRLDPTQGKLRFVAVLSNPTGTAELDLKQEETNLQTALKQLPIDLKFQINQTITDFQQALLPCAHIFHFSGHGSFQGALGDTVGDEEGEGTLSFVTDEPGVPVNFPAHKLAMNLAGAGVRFAMLGACESGKVDQMNAWTGIAPALTKAGIPAAVGMQFKIRDPNAIAFSRILYKALAAGLTIDEAVSKGRLSIYSDSKDENERDWGVPVLYLRAEEGILFPAPVTERPDAEALGDVLTETKEELSGNLATYNEDFETALKLIDKLSDYKDLHDTLHDLQFGVFPNMQKTAKGLLDTKDAVQDMRGYERDLRMAIDKLNDTVNNGKVEQVERVWIEQLTKARKQLKQAIATPEPDLQMLRSALESISDVLGTQPAAINRELRLAVGALRLSELKDIVQRVRDKLGAKGVNVDKFDQGIGGLKQMDEDLRDLMKEHDIWQESENLISVMVLMVDVASFKLIWDQLKGKASRFYSGEVKEEWAEDLKADEIGVDKAITENDIQSVKVQFAFFDRDAKLRFWDVDKLIKKKCKELIEIRSKMADKALP